MPQIINGVSCRSKIESLQHIIDQAKKGTIGPNVSKGDKLDCLYQYPSGNNCAVGSLFSEVQLKAINCSTDRWESHNEESVEALARIFGKDNIEIVTGMTIAELVTIQRVHDKALEGVYRLLSQEQEQKAKKAVQAVIDTATKMLEKAQAKV
jgi:hypothetical protein